MTSKKIKRMRVFAGPNGSGKSVVYDLVRKQYRIGYYINADNIERQLSEHGFLHLSDYGIKLIAELSPDRKISVYKKTLPEWVEKWFFEKLKR